MLLTVTKAAKMLAVSPKTIRTWAKKNILPGIKIGPRGDWRFSMEDIKQVIQGVKGVKNI